MSSSIINKIPSDIWGAILVRLPGECLIRARAVSKEWRAVIDDPCFVRAHTNKNQQQQLSSLNFIIQNRTDPSSAVSSCCYSLDLQALLSTNEHQHTIAAAATPLDLDLDFVRDSPVGVSWLLMAECNGLVLTKESYPDAFLTMWNPLTHERLDLPPPPPDLPANAFGLGYDCATIDYKVVVIQRNLQTHVYSLKSDSWGRRIMNCPVQGSVVGPGVFVRGALNWLSSKGELVALDLGTEKYNLLQMPPPADQINNTMRLNVLGGCLAVCYSGYNSNVDVWVMKDYDSSWTKLLSLERSQQNNVCAWVGFLRPVAYIMKENLLVLLQDTCLRFFLFDVEAKSFKSVEIDGSPSRKDSYSYAKQMFVGTIFRLHANCGGGGGRHVRKIVQKKRKRKASSAYVGLCIRDAKRRDRQC